jgi:hypothetical protein
MGLMWHQDTPEWAKDLAEQARAEYKNLKHQIEVLEGLVRKLLVVGSEPVTAYVYVNGALMTDITVLDSGGPLTATLSLTDADGQPADLTQLVGPPVWSSDNEATASLSVAADGMSAQVTLGAAGAAVVSVVATDADGTVVNFSGTVTVTAGEAVAGSVDFAQPTPAV